MSDEQNTREDELEKTPRTKAFFNERHTINAYRKVLGFARTLERENNRLREERRMHEAVDQLTELVQLRQQLSDKRAKCEAREKDLARNEEYHSKNCVQREVYETCQARLAEAISIIENAVSQKPFIIASQKFLSSTEPPAILKELEAQEAIDAAMKQTPTT